MNLSEDIKQYYFNHINELPAGKRFHFASRLAAWEETPEAKNTLGGMKGYMLPGPANEVLSGIISKSPAGVYAKVLRAVYFDKYPKLFGIHNAFFRIRHLKEIYGIDIREDFLKIVSQNELDDLYRKLINDRPALRILSRFAIDYIFLYEILFGVNKRMDPSLILSLKKDYDLKDTVAHHLFIYLYTHSIIADTNFYARNLPNDRLPLYRKMLEELEETMAGRDDLKLDNKFEFLVASRIAGRQTHLSSEINEQAQLSLSYQGKFIVDKLNESLHPKLNTFSGSEHRNVLFIMSGSPFKPHRAPIF